MELSEETKKMLYGAVVHHTKPVCKKCGSDLTGADRFGDFYGCKKCDSWTRNVEHKRINIGAVSLDCMS